MDQLDRKVAEGCERSDLFSLTPSSKFRNSEISKKDFCQSSFKSDLDLTMLFAWYAWSSASGGSKPEKLAQCLLYQLSYGVYSGVTSSIFSDFQKDLEQEL